MADTKGLLIFPKKWSKLRKEQLNSDKLYMADLMKFCEIRKGSKKPGEIRYRETMVISSIVLMESYTTQKRWYQALVYYNKWGQHEGYPQMEMLYFYAHPWLLGKLLEEAEKQERLASKK